MTQPIHELYAALETARLAAIQALAATGGVHATESLQRLATLQIALTAVREEISLHQVKVGGGAERPVE